MSYDFAARLKLAIPPSPPWRKYVFPKYSRKVTTTKLETNLLNPANPGKVGSIANRKVRKIVFAGAAAGGLAGLIGTLFPRVTATRGLTLSNPNLMQPGKPATDAFAGRREFDPYGDFNFVVQIEGVEAGAFQKVDGLSFDVDVIEYRDSLDPHPHSRPGIARYGNIKLTKGVIKNTALWDWCVDIMNGKIERKNGTIHILKDDGDSKSPDISYDFYAAWPCKWSGLRIDGKGGATLVEELELAVDSFSRAK